MELGIAAKLISGLMDRGHLTTAVLLVSGIFFVLFITRLFTCLAAIAKNWLEIERQKEQALINQLKGQAQETLQILREEMAASQENNSKLFSVLDRNTKGVEAMVVELHELVAKTASLRSCSEDGFRDTQKELAELRGRLSGMSDR